MYDYVNPNKSLGMVKIEIAEIRIITHKSTTGGSSSCSVIAGGDGKALAINFGNYYDIESSEKINTDKLFDIKIKEK